MEIEGYDCDDFERRAGCIPCESLIAGKISSLKGRPMSQDLFEMDQREYAVIKQEEAELQTVRENHWNFVQKPAMFNSLMALVASVVCTIASFYFDHFGLGLLSGLVALLSICSVIGNAIDVVGGKVLPKMLDIEDNRMARLQNKVGVLDDKLAHANDNDQYRVAKDFFKTKYDLYFAQRNRPITNVSQIMYHTTFKKA